MAQDRLKDPAWKEQNPLFEGILEGKLGTEGTLGRNEQRRVKDPGEASRRIGAL